MSRAGRKRLVVQITLSAAIREMLDAMAAAKGETRSAAVERLVLRAAAEYGSGPRRERLAK